MLNKFSTNKIITRNGSKVDLGGPDTNVIPVLAHWLALNLLLYPRSLQGKGNGMLRSCYPAVLPFSFKLVNPSVINCSKNLCAGFTVICNFIWLPFVTFTMLSLSLQKDKVLRLYCPISFLLVSIQVNTSFEFLYLSASFWSSYMKNN